MKTGLGDELIKLQKYKSNGAPNMANVLETAEELIEVRPCAFDDIAGHISHDDLTDSEHDDAFEEASPASQISVRKWTHLNAEKADPTEKGAILHAI